MAKLDLAAKAGPAGNRVGGPFQGSVLLSVTRADASPLTGLTGGVEIYIYQDFNVSSGFQANVNQIIEEAAAGRGEPGVYYIDWNTKGEATYPVEGVHFVTVTVRDGADVGQTVESYYVSP
jgi:hypothetical protein